MRFKVQKRQRYRGIVTRVHNPKTGYFEIKRSPPPSPTVSPVPGLHGATSDIKPSLAQARTAIKHQPSTETPHLPRSTILKQSTSKTTDSTTLVEPKSSQITGSNLSNYKVKTSKITLKSKLSQIWLNAYKTYVKPCPEYATPIWKPYKKIEIDKIEKVQKFFTRQLYRKNMFNIRKDVLNLFQCSILFNLN